MKLFMITMKAFKVFYVEADSQDEALTHPVIEDEQRPNSRGDFDWEHDETDAKELNNEEAEWLRRRHADEIAKEDEMSVPDKDSLAGHHCLICEGVYMPERRHEAEKLLNEQQRYDYVAALVGKPWSAPWCFSEVLNVFSATARQRAAAFVKTMEGKSVSDGNATFEHTGVSSK